MKRTTTNYSAALLTLALLAGTVSVAAAAPRKKANQANGESAASVPAVAYTNSIGMKFVAIPAGSYTRGTVVSAPDCPEPDAFTSRDRYNACIKRANEAKPPENETPARRITISKPFLMGQFEVTQEQWYKVMGNNPAEFKTDKVGEDSRNFPVENVSWDDAQEFVSRLSAKDGRSYRLPSEAEWEYACRGGKQGETYCGGNDVDVVAWYDGNSGKHTHRVGTKRPNGFGLYDMSGNVWEWCQDWYDANYYQSSTATDPGGFSTGSNRVFRGGSWGYYAWDPRASLRFSRAPDRRSRDLGFRVLLPPVQ